jgi:hypothetical protein
MADRCTDAELRKREADALELLASGCGTAYSSQVLATRYGCSIRTARRYVQSASFELTEALTPSELDRQMLLVLHRLDLVSGKAAAAGDDALAVRASKAHASALAAFRRALSVPAGSRFRLPHGRAAPPGDGADLPF